MPGGIDASFEMTVLVKPGEIAANASPALLNLREGHFSGHMQRQVENSAIIRLDQGNC